MINRDKFDEVSMFVGIVKLTHTSLLNMSNIIINEYSNL